MKYLKTILLTLLLASGAFAQGVYYDDGAGTITESSSYSSVVYALGGAPGIATDGTDVACDDGDRHISQIMIPNRMTITGIFYMVGSVGGTDSVIVNLFDSGGNLVTGGTSITSAADAEVLVSTTAIFQKVPFEDGTITIDPGVYYISAQFDGTTAKYRAYVVAGSPFVALTLAGTFGTAVLTITPGTSFTASEGIIGGVY